MLCRDSTLLIRLNIVPTEQEGDSVWIIIGLTDVLMMVKDSVYLPVILTFLPESVPQEQRLHMPVVLIA
jgi:hypothetical protein